MNKFCAIAMSTAALAVLVLRAGSASASGGGSAAYLAGCFAAPDQPGRVALAKLDHGCGEVYRLGGRGPGQAG